MQKVLEVVLLSEKEGSDLVDAQPLVEAVVNVGSDVAVGGRTVCGKVAVLGLEEGLLRGGEEGGVSRERVDAEVVDGLATELIESECARPGSVVYRRKRCVRAAR